MSDLTYQQSLPKKRMSAGALFFDESGRLLVVHPTYKPTWEIPGGIIELNESPHQGCVREIEEELGLIREPMRLICVDYTSLAADKTESLSFIFDGGVLSSAEIAAIRLPASELSEYHFLPSVEAVKLLNPRLEKRVWQAFLLREAGQSMYLENQQIIA